MFRPLPMRHVTLQVMGEDLTRASVVLADLEIFHPDLRDPGAEFSKIPGESYRALYHQAHTRLTKIANHLGGLPPFELGDVHVVPEDALGETNRQLGELWNECSASEERAHGTAEEGRAVTQLEAALENFASLRIDLGMLQGDRRFLDVRVGTTQSDHLPRLKEALALAYYLVFPYLVTPTLAHVIIVAGVTRQAPQKLHFLQQFVGCWSALLENRNHVQQQCTR